MSNKIKVVISIFLLSSFLSVSCYAEGSIDNFFGNETESGHNNDNSKPQVEAGSGQSTPKRGKEQPTKGGGGKKCEDCSKRVGQEKYKCEKEKKDLEQKCDKEKSGLSGKVEKLEKEKGEQEKKIAALTKEKQELTREKQNLEGNVQNLTEDSKKLRESMNELQDKLDNASGDDILKDQNRELSEKVKTLTVDLKDKEQKLLKFQSEKENNSKNDKQNKQKSDSDPESAGYSVWSILAALVLGGVIGFLVCNYLNKRDGKAAARTTQVNGKSLDETTIIKEIKGVSEKVEQLKQSKDNSKDASKDDVLKTEVVNSLSKLATKEDVSKIKEDVLQILNKIGKSDLQYPCYAYMRDGQFQRCNEGDADFVLTIKFDLTDTKKRTKNIDNIDGVMTSCFNGYKGREGNWQTTPGEVAKVEGDDSRWIVKKKGEITYL